MSRTYRKNERYFHLYKGEYYNSGYTKKNPSLKTKSNIDLKPYEELEYQPHYVPCYCCPCRVRHDVIVCDGDVYGKGIGGHNKKGLHRIDRARYRQALNRGIMSDNYDRLFDVKAAFDPWDWD